jgi:hypothetical protein
MNRHPVFIENGQKSPGQKSDPPAKLDSPSSEDDLGGGDICSPEQPSTDDDEQLD